MSQRREIEEKQPREAMLQDLFRDVIIPVANPYLAVKRCMRWDEEEKALRVGDKSYPLFLINNVFLLGAGKAGVPMSKAVVEVLRESPLLWGKFGGGVVNVYREQAEEKVTGVKFFAADHPNPNQASVEGARAILDILKKSSTGDLVIAVISGGGSSLLSLPVSGIGQGEFRITNQLLMTAGASIHEINMVRKHLSQVKGGKLRMAAPQADFLALILSDVVGDDLSTIASGPTVPDPSTFQDAIHVLKEYGPWGKLPQCVRDYLERGAQGKEEETLKPELWEQDLAMRTFNLLVGCNSALLKGLEEELGKSPYCRMGRPVTVLAPVTGKVEEAVKEHFHQAKELFQSVRNDGVSRILLYGGETTVEVPEHVRGLGGRNQHYALLAAQEIVGYPWVVLSAGTDGVDGNSPAAGAVVTGDTITLAREKGIAPEKFLADFDSHGFFREMEGKTGRKFLVHTGPTGTNVNDVMMWWLPSEG